METRYAVAAQEIQQHHQCYRNRADIESFSLLFITEEAKLELID